MGSQIPSPQICLHLKMEICFPCGSVIKESACSAGDLGSIPGLGRSPGEGKGYPLQYSGLENSINCLVHGVTKSQTRLSSFTSLHTILCFSLFSASLVAQIVKKISLQCGRLGFNPWVGEIPWRRERLPTPVVWPEEFHGYSPWGHKELDTTERLSL